MADDNKTLKYARYAIGEIVLVVIGILIALSINNWNNVRLKNKEALSLSNRLLLETNKNNEQLQIQVDRIKILQDETESLLTLFGPDYHLKNSRLLDSLIFGLLATPTYKSSTSVLEEALNTGLISILESDSIRTLLYNIPEKLESIKSYEENMTRDIESNLMPYLYEEISLRQIDQEFSEEFKLNESSKLGHFDNRVVLSKKKFENIVDNKYFLLETLLIGYGELQTVFDKSILFFENAH